MSGKYRHRVVITTTNMKYAPIFEEVGLSPNEAKIYETLLESGEAGVSLISKKANVHRRNVYDALNRLVEKGLVFPVFQSGEYRYQAVSPSKLLEMVREKENRLQEVMPNLRKLFAKEPNSQAAFIYKGIEGYKNYRRDLLRLADEAYFLGAKGLWRSPQINKQFREAYITPFEKTVPHKVLFDPRVKQTLPEAMTDMKGQHKVLPKGYETPGVVDIFNDYVVTFVSVGIGNVGEDVTIFLMKDRELAESYKTWFNLIWNLLP